MAIQQTKSGRWKVTVDVSSARTGGRRSRVTRTVDTEEEAERLHAALKGRSPELNGMTVTGLCEHYVMLRAPDLDPQTENLYRALIARYIRPAWIGALPFDGLTLEMVRRFYAQLRDGTYLDDNPTAKRIRRRPVVPLADKTVRGIHLFLASVYNDAVELEWIDRAPTRGARKRGKIHRAPKPAAAREHYSLADIAKIVEAGDDDVAELVQFGVITGARIAELAALRWRDIDFIDQTVTISASVSRTRDSDPARRGHYFRKDWTKTGDERLLSLDDDTMTMLRARFARHTQQADDAGVEPETLDSRAVFSRTLEEGFTSPGALRGQWNRALDKAGVRVKFHDLRRIACSEMMAAGVPVPNATARSGHASNAVFFDVYGRMRKDTDDPALDALAATWRRIATS